ncbi:hypothetical protein G9A89_021596 [Geosiphon pyriformis]|nr:hypothetical protein G9A89_021596 [Geosiphon pyriformis]
MNKDHIIKSVQECSFHKVVLNHLVVDNKLILKPVLVKSKIDVIIEGWTKKHKIADDIFGNWHYQYQSLEYVFDKTFFGVMCSIEFDEFFEVVSNLPNDKAAGLSDILNELWKHCDKAILDMLLALLNSCLSSKSVPGFWREAWISIISKPYEWEGVLMNTYFGLTDNYCMHNDLDQEKIFFLFLWCIFYDPLLCEVKHQKSVCEYRLNSYFISRSGRTESQTGLFSFFTIGTFVDNTIWVGSSQSATQHILNVAGEFFQINNILINNDKMVAIPINSRVNNSSLFISGSPISIAKKGESHQYLGIYLSTKDLLKPSLAKTHSDVCFFTNLVLRKTVSDKQFLYLVLVVFYPIVSYRMQFSFVSVGMYNKWNALIHKSLKLKSSLLFDFSGDTIHHSSFYDLKSFLQVQSKSKIAFLVSFMNFILCWHPVYSLSSFVHICVSASNNFLTDIVHILLNCNLFLSGFLASFFWFHGGILMFAVLNKSSFLKFLFFLHWYDIVFVNQLCNNHDAKKLDSCGPFLKWFKIFTTFFNSVTSFFAHLLALSGVGSLNILNFGDFVSVCDNFFWVGSGSLSVYTNGFLKDLGTVNCKAGTATFFKDINLTIALALECVLLSSFVHLFLNSQSALDACKLELGLVKSHSDIIENKLANVIAGTTFFSGWCFFPCLDECFIVADSNVVSGNFRHFIGSCSKFLMGSLLSEIDWLYLSLVWDPDLHMAIGFTGRLLASIAGLEVVKFACFSGLTFWDKVWMVCVKHCAYIEKAKLIPLNGSVLVLISGLVLEFSVGVVKLLGITKAFE